MSIKRKMGIQMYTKGNIFKNTLRLKYMSTMIFDKL